PLQLLNGVLPAPRPIESDAERVPGDRLPRLQFNGLPGQADRSVWVAANRVRVRDQGPGQVNQGSCKRNAGSVGRLQAESLTQGSDGEAFALAEFCSGLLLQALRFQGAAQPVVRQRVCWVELNRLLETDDGVVKVFRFVL